MTEREDSSSPSPALGYASETTSMSSAAVLGTVGLKLLGVYFIASALPSIVILLGIVLDVQSLSRTEVFNIRFISGVGSIAMQLGVGVLLLLRGRWMAQRLFGHDAGMQTALSAIDVIKLAVAGIGIFMVVTALPEAISGVFFILGEVRDGQAEPRSFRDSLLFGARAPFVSFLTLGIGMLLALRPGWVAEKWRNRSDAL